MSGRFLLGQAALDPPLTKVAGRSPSGTDSVSLDPLLTPSENRKAVLVGRRFRLARPRYYKQVGKTFQGQKSPGHGHLRSRGCETDLQNRFEQSPQDY